MKASKVREGLSRNSSDGAMLSFFLQGGRRATLLRAAAMTLVIALADWRIEGNIPLGFLYLFPTLLAGTVLTRLQIGFSALLFTVLTEAFDSYEWLAPAAFPRDILIFTAFFCTGQFVYEIVRSRHNSMQHSVELEREALARGEAEEQLAVLIESSPAAVFTTDARGTILLANQAAHRLFGVGSDSLRGRSVQDFLPSLGRVVAGEKRAPIRTAMQCRGRRLNGEVFLADVWFSTYSTRAGSRLAAMVTDGSEDLRNREELSLHQLLAGSRILVGAVSHEIRNVCGAIAMAHANLARRGELAGNKDFEALGNLILALEKIASMDLREVADQSSSVDLPALLEELRIVVESSLGEQDIVLKLDVEPGLPPVWADRQSLLQVFLNLTKNSERAMTESADGTLTERAYGAVTERCLTLTARREAQGVSVRFRDTGCGVAHPERLFRPFQQQAQATGLGLYLSRAFMRSFRGELRFEPEADGSSFIVELSAATVTPAAPLKDNHAPSNPDSAGRRSQPVPGEPEPVARG